MNKFYYFVFLIFIIILLFLNNVSKNDNFRYDDLDSVNNFCLGYTDYYDKELSLKIVNESKKYLGISYLLGSKIANENALNPIDKYNSIDCSDFVSNVLEEVIGENYESTAAGLAFQLRNNCVRLDNLKSGDIIFWSDFASARVFNRYGRIFHVGIYLDNNRVIEATHSDSFGFNGVVYSDLYRFRGGSLVMIVRAYR